jgi:site-specific recombinase XerD
MDKYTIRLILWEHNANVKGLFPIYLKITVNRKTSYKSTGYFANKKDWDDKNEKLKSNFPNYASINAKLSTLKNDLEKQIISTQLKGLHISAASVKKSLGKDLTNIFEYVDHLIINQKGKKSDNTLENYRKHLLKLETFNNGRVLRFDDIDVIFLARYERWLREHIKFRKEDSQKNYIHAIWKTLKTWFNAAKKERLISSYPFDFYENPTYVAPDKDHLNKDELKLMEDFADTTNDPVLKECAIYFLFGCYSGLRISDWYRFNFKEHIKENKIRIRPAKTKNKWVEMIISKPLKRNFKRMECVPLTLKEPTINEKLKIIAGKAKINKYLTSHSARGSFAVTICLGNKISSETAAELMGITLETFVKNYSEVTQEKIDNETTAAWEKLR